MSFRFTFTDLRDESELKKLITFLHGQNLGYPDYGSWVERTEHEIDIGYKRATIAISDRRIVGNLVYQTHKGLGSLLEIKNLRVHPDFRMRDFARFMLKQLEIEAQELYQAIIGDIRQNQEETLGFMLSCGYTPIATIPLYDETPDVSVVKILTKKDSDLLMPKVKKVVTRTSH